MCVLRQEPKGCGLEDVESWSKWEDVKEVFEGKRTCYIFIHFIILLSSSSIIHITLAFVFPEDLGRIRKVYIEMNIFNFFSTHHRKHNVTLHHTKQSRSQRTHALKTGTECIGVEDVIYQLLETSFTWMKLIVLLELTISRCNPSTYGIEEITTPTPTINKMILWKNHQSIRGGG